MNGNDFSEQFTDLLSGTYKPNQDHEAETERGRVDMKLISFNEEDNYINYSTTKETQTEFKHTT